MDLMIRLVVNNNCRYKVKGVSEMVSTLMLISLTVAGSLLIYNYMSKYVNVENIKAKYGSIVLIGYDSRDGNGIGGIQHINNHNDRILCAKSCRIDMNPANNGTEYIVIYVKNRSDRSIIINDIIVNGAIHTWNNSMPPRGGTFNLIVGDNTVQNNSNINELLPSATSKILLKLSNNIDDIPIGSMIEIGIPLDGYIYRYSIVAGDMR